MNTPEPVEFRRSLTILHLALCMGCAMFMAVMAFLWNDGTIPMGEAGLEVLPMMGLLMAVVLPALAILLFRQRVRAIPVGAPFPEVAAGLRAACVMQWALIEAPLFFNLVIFMLTADRNAAGMAIALLIVLILRAPSEKRLQRWLTGTA